MKNCRSGDGFTLVELLVVITVISILIALIVPAITSARERGRSIRCVANLKELHAAAMNYTLRDANNYYGGRNLPNTISKERHVPGFVPDRWDTRTGWVDWTGHVKKTAVPGYTKWWGLEGYQSIVNGSLWDYTGKNLKVYSCPTFNRSDVVGFYNGGKDPLGAGTLSYDFQPQKNAVLRSYGMNAYCDEKGLGSDVGVLNISNVSCSANVGSRMLLFADMAVQKTNAATSASACMTDKGPYDDGSMKGWNWDGALSAWGSSTKECIGNYHNGKGNAIFVDGHVESLPLEGSTLKVDTVKACTGDW